MPIFRDETGPPSRMLRAAGMMRAHCLPAIMITGDSDVAIAVQAMEAGASDFIEKPISRVELLRASIAPWSNRGIPGN